MRSADNLTTFMCRLSGHLGVSASWNPQGLSRPVQGLLYLYLYLYFHFLILLDIVLFKDKKEFNLQILKFPDSLFVSIFLLACSNMCNYMS